jgi:hypothetical protein
VSRFALIGLAAAGCFYTDPINQRPSLDIKRGEPLVVYREGTIEVDAVSVDPDGHDVFFHWRAYACTDQTSCDPAPFFELSDPHAEIEVPPARVASLPLVTVRIVLEGIDSFGATAKPAQELWVALENYAPTVEIRTASSFGNVVGKPISIFARIGDEDRADMPQLTWQVFSPVTQPAYEFVDMDVVQDPMDTDHITYGKRFTPDGEGTFEVQVTADDGLGLPTSTTTVREKILVGGDKPPCLRQLSPLVAAAPSALPMSEPTLFQVHVVADDLDPYPSIDPTSTTTFKWSLLAPGSPSYQLLSGVSGNTVALDPAAYQLGDIVELRVEIYDRKNTAITCAASSASCAVDSTNPTCIQRQTWRAEVR